MYSLSTKIFNGFISDTIAGLLQANASNTGNPSPSFKDGNNSILDFLYSSICFSVVTEYHHSIFSRFIDLKKPIKLSREQRTPPKIINSSTSVLLIISGIYFNPFLSSKGAARIIDFFLGSMSEFSISLKPAGLNGGNEYILSRLDVNEEICSLLSSDIDRIIS